MSKAVSRDQLQVRADQVDPCSQARRQIRAEMDGLAKAVKKVQTEILDTTPKVCEADLPYVRAGMFDLYEILAKLETIKSSI